MTETKTHYRKAFDSPYLSSADVVDPLVFTVSKVTLEKDRTKKTQDVFNTAWFAEKEIRPGEPLKPMILNAHNSKMLKDISGSAFIEDWQNLRVMIYVDKNVRFGKDTVEGLRISQPPAEKKYLTPENTAAWNNAKAAFKRDGDLRKVLARIGMSEEHQLLLISECEEKPE